MYDPFSENHSRPAEGDRLFAWIFVPTLMVCQIVPHYFGLERFLAWEVEKNGTWFFLAAMVALIITFSIIGLINLVFWISDRRAKAGQTNETQLSGTGHSEKEPISGKPK